MFVATRFNTGSIRRIATRSQSEPENKLNLLKMQRIRMINPLYHAARDVGRSSTRSIQTTWRPATEAEHGSAKQSTNSVYRNVINFFFLDSRSHLIYISIHVEIVYLQTKIVCDLPMDSSSTIRLFNPYFSFPSSNRNMVVNSNGPASNLFPSNAPGPQLPVPIP